MEAGGNDISKGHFVASVIGARAAILSWVRSERESMKK
jgi:hypothetical protein